MSDYLIIILWNHFLYWRSWNNNLFRYIFINIWSYWRL